MSVETPAQAGRYLAQTHLLRAIIEILADVTDRTVGSVQAEIKAKTDFSTATMRLGAIGNEGFSLALQKMDIAIAAVLAQPELGSIS
jgi:hypothetical protein